ncbi:MAG TPA: hypothetical protein VIJ46_02570, partial [Rhabdochlamydiaceae bacterium]
MKNMKEKDTVRTVYISTPPLRQFSPLRAFASLREFPLLSGLLLQNLGLRTVLCLFDQVLFV